MSRIGVDIEASVSGLDDGMAKAERRVGEFSSSVEKSSQSISSAAQKAGEVLGQVGKEAATGDFSRIPETLGRAAISAPELAGAVIGLVAPFALVAATVAALTMAYSQGHEESKAFERTLIMTGNAAVTSAGQLMEASHQVAEATGATQAASAAAINALAASGKVGAEALNATAQAAIDLERVGVAAIDATVKQFASLGEDPVKASIKLNEQYHYLTGSIYEQIKALEDQGRDEEAAALAQNAFASELSARAGKIKESLGTLERAWMGTKDAAREAWDAMLNPSREDSLLQQLTAAREKLASGSFGFGGESEARMRVAVLTAQVEAQLMSNHAQGESNQQAEAAIKWAQEGDKYRSKQLIMEQEITRARLTGNEAGKSEAEIAARIGQIRKKYTEKPKDDEYEKLMNRLSGLDANYGQELNALYGAYQNGRIGLDEYSSAVERLIQKQPFATRAAQEEKKALEEQAKVLEHTARADERAAKAMTEFIIRSDDRVEAITRSNELIGKTPEQAALINAFADIDRAAAAARVKIEEVLGAKGDIDGIDNLVGQLQRLTELLKGRTAEALDEHKRKQDELNASWEYGADEALRKYLLEVGNVALQSERMFSHAFAGMDDALSKFVRTGKLDFKSLSDSIINDLIKMQVQASVTGPLMKAMSGAGGIGGMLGGLFGGGNVAAAGTSDAGPTMGLSDWFTNIFASAKGNVFSGAPDLHQYVNTVQTQPTYFGFDRVHAYAKGGVFAEAGPEAVMPLTRDSQNNLGIRAIGGAGAIEINIINNNAGNNQVSASSRKDASGKNIIDVLIEAVKSNLIGDVGSGGAFAGAMEGQYALNRAAKAWR